MSDQQVNVQPATSETPVTGAQQQQPEGLPQPPARETQPRTWDAVLGALPEPDKQLYEQHTSGLKSALDNERRERRGLETQIRELASKAEKGSEQKRVLDEMSVQLTTANERADFFEEGARPEIGCTGLQLAWLAIQARREDFVKRGRVDWANFKAAYPQLFAQPVSPPGHAGTNTQAQPVAQTMNSLIRRAAGRQP